MAAWSDGDAEWTAKDTVRAVIGIRFNTAKQCREFLIRWEDSEVEDSEGNVWLYRYSHRDYDRSPSTPSSRH